MLFPLKEKLPRTKGASRQGTLGSEALSRAGGFSAAVGVEGPPSSPAIGGVLGCEEGKL